jgi:ubiquinol-cytochrome c reductase cytochrome c1 subunit
MRIILSVLCLSFATAVFAAEGPELESVRIDLGDKASLQRGARTFINYCMSCHSAHFSRFNRVAKDLEIPNELMVKNLMFTTKKIGDTMTVAMRSDDAEKWFGVAPPDLSVVARARGADWLYTYLKSFYLDPKRPTGVNNLVFDKTAMPDVLWTLQGLQRPIMKTEKNDDGKDIEVIDGFELARHGLETKEEYDRTVHDLVNFLVYMGEPARLIRTSVGVWVILFLLALLAVAYPLKKEYWKDVH